MPQTVRCGGQGSGPHGDLHASRSRSFETRLHVGNVEAEAKVIILAETLTESEAERLGYTLVNVEAKALVDTLSYNLAETW